MELKKRTIEELESLCYSNPDKPKLLTAIWEELSSRKKDREKCQKLETRIKLRLLGLGTEVPEVKKPDAQKALSIGKPTQVKLAFSKESAAKQLKLALETPTPLAEEEIISEDELPEEKLPNPPRLKETEITKGDYTINSAHGCYEPFCFLVRKWFTQYGMAENTLYTYNTLSTYLLGKGYGMDTELVTEIIQHYRDYFLPHKPNALQVRPDFKRIYRDFPAIWGEAGIESVKSRMIRAVNDEIQAVGRSIRRSYVHLKSIRHIGNPAPKVLLYEAQLDMESDDMASFADGVTYKLLVGKDFRTYVTVVLFVPSTGKLFFQTSRAIHSDAESYKIVADGRVLLYQLRERLEEANADVPFARLFSKKSKIEVRQIPEMPQQVAGIPDKLDASQKAAYNHALTQNLTYIWGPPGTGKSTTLGHILKGLLVQAGLHGGGRTLVVSTANTAVDELTLKTIEDLHLEPGHVLRFGRAVKQELNSIPSLFPDDAETIKLRQEISECQARIWEGKITDEYRAVLASKIEVAKYALTALMRQKLSNAKIIFCSAAKALQEEVLREMPFDNLVIDEASMLSPAYLFPLVQNIRKRVIIAGDPKQLGPIATAVTQYAEQWLQRDLFSLLGKSKDILQHPAVRMLKTQRRFSEAICRCINERFYEGQLSSAAGENAELRLRHSGELHEQCKAFATWPQGKKEGEKARNEFKGVSRANGVSRSLVTDILCDQLSHFDIKTVGVISPYRAQVNAYKRDWDAMQSKPELDVRFGTIHTFQGGECHAILLDLTEAGLDPNGKILKPGKLFHNNTGERLINVAVSRAQRLLIVVGDRNVFKHPNGAQVSYKVKSLFEELPFWKSL